jgi:hypothetical protein
MNLFPHK